MSFLMSDLVEKAKGINTYPKIVPSQNGKYRYRKWRKTIQELSEISGFSVTALENRFRSRLYKSVEEAVDNRHGLRRNR